MSVRTGGGGAAAVLVALCIAGGARAGEPGDRLGPVVSARIEMQRQLGEVLTRSLSGPAEPYRVEAVVRLELRGAVRELRAKQESASPAVKIGGKSKVKLPGFGVVEGGGGGAPLLPEINIEGGTRVTEQVSRQLETEVVRMSVLLFVDPAMPKERRELLTRLAADLAGVDRARGDEVIVEERAAAPAATSAAVASEGAGRRGWELAVICATALAAAGLLAFGLSRRTAVAHGALGRGGDGAGKASEEGTERTAGAKALGDEAAEAVRRRREESGAFGTLAEATPDEVARVIAMVDQYTAVAIVDLFGLDAATAKLLEGRLTPERRTEIGVGLARTRVLTRAQLTQMEGVAAKALEAIRDRVELGGPARLAGFLAGASATVRQQLLADVEAKDAEGARAARAELLLFEDLQRFDATSVRRIVSVVDPATVALALVGATEVAAIVAEAVSERLRGILEVEAEVAQRRPAEQVDAARRTVEEAMRVLHARGDLQVRAPAPAEAAAA